LMLKTPQVYYYYYYYYYYYLSRTAIIYSTSIYALKCSNSKNFPFSRWDKYFLVTT